MTQTTSDTNDELLTVPETATALNCSRIHVYRLVASGDLKAINIAKANAKKTLIRIPASALNTFKNRAAVLAAPTRLP